MFKQLYIFPHIFTDQVISSSAKRRRKCWSELQHNESIDELFDRLANTPPVVVMDTNSDEVISGCGQDHVIKSTEEEFHNRSDKKS